MEVFVIPVGQDLYELYYEQIEELAPDAEPPPTGIIAKLQRRFGELLRAAEEHHGRRAEGAETPQSWAGRMQGHLLSWIGKRIAEQRLLWNLRKQSTAVAVHPGDVDFEKVLVHVRRVLQRDFERHRFWLVVDAIGLVISGALAVIPGPNLLAYFFLFRVGGHWLSMRGATQGRRRVVWTGRPCEALVRLRAALQGDGPDRHQRIQGIASELHLRSLAPFVERVARVKR